MVDGRSIDNDQQPLTVGQVAGLVRGVLAESLPAKLRVVGQVSNFADRSHWFFSLKDESASIRCVCFASAARRVRFDVADGLEVVADGRIDFYEASGQVQFYVDRLEPVGQGALEMRFRALCEQLRSLGYFDVERKKPLPGFSRRVAVVTSRSAAALQDVIHTARRRWPGCELVLVDVRVQGDAAAGEIAAAINGLSNDGERLGIDAIIVTRGGGSMEDLWAFNERVVADAVYRCRVPILAAIGHETDTTVAELVADLRCATPTQAAMAVVPDQEAFEDQIGQLAVRLGLQLKRQHQMCVQRYRAASRHPVFARPQRIAQTARQDVDHLAERLKALTLGEVAKAREVIGQVQQRLSAIEPRGRVRIARQRVNHACVRLVGIGRHQTQPLGGRLSGLAERLSRAISGGIERRRVRVASLGGRLSAVGPRNVLERGYTYTLTHTGEVVRRASQVPIGTRIVTVFAEGQLGSTVVSRDTTGNVPAKPAPTKRGRREKQSRPEDDTPTLFDQ